MDYTRSERSQRGVDHLRKRQREDDLHAALDDLTDALENVGSFAEEVEDLIAKLIPGETASSSISQGLF